MSDAAQASPGSPAAEPHYPPLQNLALARGEVDRATQRRGDGKWLAAAWADPRTRVLVVNDGAAAVTQAGDGADLVLLPSAQAPDGLRMLLGESDDGTAWFGVIAPLPASSAGARPATLREVGPLLSDRDIGLMTHAVALANFHGSFQHCPRCGARTEPSQGGYARHCPVDGSEHFPRVDPAMIVLVTDPDDRVLLARNTLWPPRRVSVLAGFVEAGESAEQAVQREVCEETGLAVTGVRYLGSQSWPMPQSLMLGFRARAGAGQQIQVDAEEIAEANWFSRDELSASIAAGRIHMPPSVSIARRMIEAWFGGELPGTW